VSPPSARRAPAIRRQHLSPWLAMDGILPPRNRPGYE